MTATRIDGRTSVAGRGGARSAGAAAGDRVGLAGSAIATKPSSIDGIELALALDHGAELFVAYARHGLGGLAADRQPKSH